MHKLLAPLILFSLLITGSAHAELSPAPTFMLPTRSGMITPADLKGKVIYLDFWASWCFPCRKSFPWLNEIQDKYKDQGLVVLGINLDKDRELADKFLQAVPANFIIAFDPEGESASSFKVKGMPSSYLIDRHGNLRARHTGFREDDRNNLEQAVAELLSAK